MAEIVEMIALSPTMEEGTLAEWYKSEGDRVEEGEVIADVETDKATMEMESWYDGTLLKLLAEEGDAVAVGEAIAIVGEEGEDISDLLDQAGGGAPTGDEAEEADEAEAEEADEADEADEAEEARETKETEKTETVEAGDEDRLRASPLARRIASDEGIDLENVKGSGPHGRIIKQDVESYLEEGAPEAEREAREAPAAPAPAEVPSEIFRAADVAGEEIPLSQMRKTIAKRLRASWQNVPHFTLTRSIDMGAAMQRRKEINDQLAEAEYEVKISVNDLIVKAVAKALERYPKMNVSYQGDHVIKYDDVNIGVAVAIEDGLVTPVIRNADEKSLSSISEDSKDLARKARDKELMPEDYAGGTFTVSNLGMFGIDHFMAVINPPEAGILACGKVDQVPVVEDGDLTVGTQMKVTLSCDHRAVDGAIGARFLQEVARLLENPVLLTV